MQTQHSAKTRYISFVVSAALGLGILGPVCLAHAEEEVTTPPAVAETSNPDGDTTTASGTAASAAQPSAPAAAGAEDPDAAEPGAAGTLSGSSVDGTSPSDETTSSSGGSPAVTDNTGATSPAAAGDSQPEAAGTAGSSPAGTASSNAAPGNAAPGTGTENSSTAEESKPEEKDSFTVTIDDRYFGESSFTVKSGSSIDPSYGLEFKAIHGAAAPGGTETYILQPSKFKNTATDETYTLEQLHKLEVTSDMGLRVINYVRKLPLTYYTFDGRPTVTDITLFPQKIYRDNTAANGGTLVGSYDLPALTFYDVPAKDPSGGKATSRIGICSTVILLEHIDESTDVRIKYILDDDVFPKKQLPSGQLFARTGGHGGYTAMLDAIMNGYYISVSDATAENPVTPKVDVEYTTFDDGHLGNVGEKIVYTRTVEDPVNVPNYQLSYWWRYGQKVMTLTKSDGTRTENETLYTSVPELTIVKGPYRNDVYDATGNYDVLGVASFKATPQPMEGYRIFMSGDGLYFNSPVTITYIRELQLSYDFGVAGGSADAVTVLHRMPLNKFVEKLPGVEAPEGYTFDGWKVNGEGDAITVDYVPMTAENINLVASFSEKAAPEPDPNGNGDTDPAGGTPGDGGAAGTPGAQPVTPQPAADGADSSSTADGTGADSTKPAADGADKKPGRKQIAKTADMTSAVPSVLVLLSGGAAVIAGAAAAALGKARKKD